MDLHRRCLPELHLIDLVREHLGLELELVVDRDDVHHRLCGRDHAADGVDVELVDIAVAGSTDVDALQLVLGRHAALGIFRDLALDLAQLLHRLGAHLLVDLDDLELGLGDAAFRLGDRRDELAALAFDAGGIALEGVQAGDRNQVLLVEGANTLQLVRRSARPRGLSPSAAPSIRRSRPGTGRCAF